MAYKLITEDEPLQIQGIVTVIYGIPGIGKTSLGYTAERPILEDYEDGTKRSVNRKTIMKIDKWEDAVEFHNSNAFEEFAPKTIVIDTAGVMLDSYIASYVIRQDIKNARSGGELSLQGYGAMKNVFRQFVNSMKTKGVDLVFICHAEKQKESDEIKFIPKMTGGSYDILFENADLVGFMESKSNKRVLQFSPTDRNEGKNTAEFPLLEVPHYTAPEFSNFLANLIAKTKSKMMELSEAQRSALKLLNEHREKIEAAKDLTAIENLIPEIEKMKDSFKIQLLSVADKKYKELLQEVIEVISRPEEADEMLKKAGEYPVRYQTIYKQALRDHTLKNGIEFNKETGKFFISQTKPEIQSENIENGKAKRTVGTKKKEAA